MVFGYPLPLKGTAWAALAAIVLAAAAGAVFAGWMSYDAEIFRAMVDAGLAWCM